MNAEVLRFSDYDRPTVPRWPRDPEQLGDIVIILPIVRVERHPEDPSPRRLNNLKPKG